MREPVLQRFLLPNDRAEWSVCVVGLDRASKLLDLSRAMGRGPSKTGEIKHIDSGFAYWGVAPTLAWHRACDDYTYPVMKRSIESFDTRWKEVRHELDTLASHHYVSLGPGTGHKDCNVLSYLLSRWGEAHYVAVDMSAEMLRIGVQRPVRELGLILGTQVIPIQLDFSDVENVIQLRKRLDSAFGGDPIVFSLLGNTLANFNDDRGLLAMLVEELLRTQDRLLLEVATTARIDAALADRAADEYNGARFFREWVMSGLLQYTDLTPVPDSVEFRGETEDGHSLRITVEYVNRGPDIRLIVPSTESVPFPTGDTIRLDLTRKYTSDSLLRMCAESGVSVLAHKHEDIGAVRVSGGLPGDHFGMDLLLLQRSDA